MKKYLIMMMAAVAVVLSCASCSSDDDNNGGSNPTATVTLTPMYNDAFKEIAAQLSTLEYEGKNESGHEAATAGTLERKITCPGMVTFVPTYNLRKNVTIDEDKDYELKFGYKLTVTTSNGQSYSKDFSETKTIKGNLISSAIDNMILSASANPYKVVLDSDGKITVYKGNGIVDAKLEF